MKIALATIQTPFIHGGAEYLITGLQRSLAEAGHVVERIAIPFRFSPLKEVERSMRIWMDENLTLLNGHQVDRVICLQFPAYYVKHPVKVLWLLHQFRVFYELWDTPFYCPPPDNSQVHELRKCVQKEDRQQLADIPERFTISRNVSARLQRYNGISSIALYHPPFEAEKFFNQPAEAYVFAPSRLEEAKRHELLIRAMPQVRSPVVAIICGEGGQQVRLEKLVADLGLAHRVKFVGRVSEAEKRGLYANCLCVFFGPYDEDYGYVTLEAMLSSKAVITCADSGGPLEFVKAEQTGLVVAPHPEAIADAVDRLFDDRPLTARMGQSGREHYHRLNITWDSVVQTLTNVTHAVQSEIS